MPWSRSFVCCFFIVYFFFLLSCHKKNIVGPEGPQGSQGQAGESSIALGNIQGQIVLYDIFGQPLPNDSGAIVSLENTSPLLQATSAIDGSFTIPSVHEGSYNISVQKPGYGSMLYFNFANSGTEPPSETGILSLGQQMPSQYDIKQLKFDTGGYYPTFTAILAHPQQVSNPVILFFNDSTGVGNSKNKYASWWSFYQQDDTTLICDFTLNLADASAALSQANYLYVSAAVDNAKDPTYKDENGNQVYPDIAMPSPELIINNVLHKY